MKFDYQIVGSGLFGATFAHLATKQGKKCLVIDKRSHLGGNINGSDITLGGTGGGELSVLNDNNQLETLLDKKRHSGIQQGNRDSKALVHL